MKGAADRRRRTCPPHASHTVSGGSEIRWRISKTRPHLRHSYSYVGIRIEATRGGLDVSRRHGLWLAWMVLFCGAVPAVSGCATKESAQRTEVQKLQARAAYDRAPIYLSEKQPAPAMTALQEAISVNPNQAVYRDTLGVVLLELGRPDMALEHFQKAVEIDPIYADAYFHMGTALAEARKWDEAVAAYKKALSLPTLTIPE